MPSASPRRSPACTGLPAKTFRSRSGLWNSTRTIRSSPACSRRTKTAPTTHRSLKPPSCFMAQHFSPRVTHPKIRHGSPSCSRTGWLARYRRTWPLGWAALVAVPHLAERHTTVSGVLAGEVQHPLPDDVPRHFDGAAAHADRLPGQVPQTGLQALPLCAHDTGRSGDRQPGVHLQRHGLGVEKPDQGSGGGREAAVADTAVDMAAQLIADRTVHQCPTGQLLYPLVVGLPYRLCQRHIVHRRRPAALAATAAGEFRTHSHRAALMVELARGHRPPLVDLADNGVVADVDTIEKLLTELRGAIELSDAPQRDSGMLDGHQEHGQAVVLGHIPVGTGQTKAVVGGECACAPGLCAVDHPAVAIALGTGDHTGQVRSAAGLR